MEINRNPNQIILRSSYHNFCVKIMGLIHLEDNIADVIPSVGSKSKKLAIVNSI